MLPQIVVEDLRVEAMAPQIYRIRLRLANCGELPTHVTNKCRQLARLKPMRLAFESAPGVTLLSRNGHQNLGHLPGVTGSAELEWFVQARDTASALATLRVSGGTGGNLVQVIHRPRS